MKFNRVIQLDSVGRIRRADSQLESFVIHFLVPWPKSRRDRKFPWTVQCGVIIKSVKFTKKKYIKFQHDENIIGHLVVKGSTQCNNNPKG